MNEKFVKIDGQTHNAAIDTDSIYKTNAKLNNDNTDLALEMAMQSETIRRLTTSIEDLWHIANKSTIKIENQHAYKVFFKQQLATV